MSTDALARETEEQLDAVRRVDSQAVRSGKLDLMKELGEAKKQLAEIEAKYGSDIDLVGLRKQLDVKDGELRSAGERESQLNQVHRPFSSMDWVKISDRRIILQQLEVLMNEVDRLSVSWETLNEQIQHPDKSFKCWEEEREKLSSQVSTLRVERRIHIANPGNTSRKRNRITCISKSRRKSKPRNRNVNKRRGMLRNN